MSAKKKRPAATGRVGRCEIYLYCVYHVHTVYHITPQFARKKFNERCGGKYGENKLNIQRFGEALARALTVQYETEYPGLKITLTGIEKRTEDYPPGAVIAKVIKQ